MNIIHILGIKITKLLVKYYFGQKSLGIKILTKFRWRILVIFNKTYLENKLIFYVNRKTNKQDFLYV